MHRKTVFEALGRKPVHPFPARMAPGIVLNVLSTAQRSLRVLDPMMGSGTVVALARSLGHKAYGIDIDPLSVLTATVWTRAVDLRAIRTKAQQVLKRARRNLKSLLYKNAYPAHADKETRKFVRYWFDAYVRRQMAALSTAIANVRDTNIRDALWCAFSRLVIAKQAGVSLALDLAHSRPHKAFHTAPIKPFNNFIEAVEHVVQGCVALDQPRRGPMPCTELGDSRNLTLPNQSIDLVVTSPPYLNAIDYLRCSKFSLVWMGYKIGELRSLRAHSVGSEIGEYDAAADSVARQIVGRLELKPKLTTRHDALLVRYVTDMEKSIREVARVLTPGGKAIYVVGENTVRGTYIRNSTIVVALARHCGLKLSERRTRRLPANRRYLPPPLTSEPRGSIDVRLSREVVLTFRKPEKQKQKHARSNT